MDTTTTPDVKALLHARLQADRTTLWQKASGLPQWRQRLPVTDTGTNLLGLVLHVAAVEAGYFGECFGEPVPDLPAYLVEEVDGVEMDDDLWAYPEESADAVFALAHRIAEHSDRLIEARDLDAPAHVAWWGPGGRDVTLAELLVHMLDETARHLGHADLVREQLDGAVGYREGNENLPEGRSKEQWLARRQRLTEVALGFKDPAEGEEARGGRHV